jgi:hypothetical protein
LNTLVNIAGGAEGTNHHCGGRSSRDKYYEDNPPRGNFEKESKTDLVKQDVEDCTYRTLILHHHH